MLKNGLDTDYHFVKRVAGDPHPVLLGPLEQLRQVRLQTIPTGILAIDAVISLLQSKEVVMHITQVMHISQAFILRICNGHPVFNPVQVGRQTRNLAVTLELSANWYVKSITFLTLFVT